MAEEPKDPDRQFALVVAQEGKAQRTLAKFLALLLNYRYGYKVEMAEDSIQAAGAIRRHGRRIRRWQQPRRPRTRTLSLRHSHCGSQLRCFPSAR